AARRPRARLGLGPGVGPATSAATLAEEAPGVAPPPRFTVVLPVRNGGSYVKEDVESVLAQSVGDFTQQLPESASRVGPAEWLRTLRDARIRLWPAPAPLSIQENWRRAVALPKAEFMLFVGHDDRLDPNYLTVVDALTHRAPDAALFTT